MAFFKCNKCLVVHDTEIMNAMDSELGTVCEICFCLIGEEKDTELVQLQKEYHQEIMK